MMRSRCLPVGQVKKQSRTHARRRTCTLDRVGRVATATDLGWCCGGRKAEGVRAGACMARPHGRRPHRLTAAAAAATTRSLASSMNR